MRLAPESMHGQGCGAHGGMQYSAAALHSHDGNAGHGRCAVDHGKGLLWLKDIGVQAGFFQGLPRAHAPACIKNIPLAGKAGSDIGHGRQITRCAHRSLAGHNRRNAKIQKCLKLPQQATDTPE